MDKETGITNLGQVYIPGYDWGDSPVFIPEEDWGPFSTPVDILLEDSVNKTEEAAQKQVVFWKRIAYFLLAVTILFGVIFLIAKLTDGKKN